MFTRHDRPIDNTLRAMLSIKRRIIKFLIILLGSVFTLSLLLVLIGPLLISTQSISGTSSAQEVARADSQFVAIPSAGNPDLLIHYLQSPPQTEGAGDSEPPWVLLHGFTFNSFTWNPLIEALSADRAVLAYDQLPYGLSAKPLQWQGDNPYSKEAALAHLWAFLDAKGIEQAVLVGNSSGATLAMEAALMAPERVSALVLINPWVYVQRPTLPEWLTRLPQMQRISLWLARQLGTTHWLLELSYHDPQLIDDERRSLSTLHTEIQDWDLAWGALLARSLSSPVTVSAQLAQITQPTQVIIGAEDRVVSPDDSLRVAAELPNAQAVVLPGCGHVPQEECPQAVLEAMLTNPF